MSENANNSPDEAAAQPKQRRFNRGKIAKRAVAITLAGSAAFTANQYRENQDSQIKNLKRAEQVTAAKVNDRLGRVANTAAGLVGNGVTPETVLGKGLLDVKRLPDYGQKVSAESLRQIQGATVKVVRQYNGDSPVRGRSNPWIENCTGTKINFQGESYVLLADHCIDQGKMPQKGGAFSVDNAAENVTAFNDYDYGVVVPHEGRVTLENVARATAVSANVVGFDFALLKIESNPEFDAIPSIDANQFSESMKAISGQEVAMYSYPGAANNKAVPGRGIFLGTFDGPVGDTRQVMLVGLTNADVPNHDACNYGASGSSAIVAGGRVLGPLSRRYPVHYKPGSPSNAPDNPQYEAGAILQLEQESKFNLQGFDVLCGYAPVTTSDIASLVRGLDVPFQLPASEPVPAYGGMK